MLVDAGLRIKQQSNQVFLLKQRALFDISAQDTTLFIFLLPHASCGRNRVAAASLTRN